MPPTTCYGYSKRYKTVETFKKNIIRHAKQNKVIIDETDDLTHSIEDFIKVMPKAMSQKRPFLSLDETSDTRPNSPKRLCISLEEKIEEFPVKFPKLNDESIENAALSTQIEELQAAVVAAPPAIPFNGVHKPLVLNGFTIEVDPDTFMVNATMMCKAAGKLFGDYHRQKKTDEYLSAISLDMGIHISKLVQRNQSGRGTSQDTNVHFLVALHLAYWLSTEVQAQFSKWIAELLLTGRVELGNEMNVQQLEDVWKRRIEEVQAKASADVKAEQDRCREIILQKNNLEKKIIAMEEDTQRSDEENKALVAIKAREDLEAAIQFQVNTTAPRIANYKEGDNVLYLARIDKTKFKYGHTKNLKQRLEAHRRPGVYPTLELVWIVKSNNGVASEDQLHAYVKKKKIIAEYGAQREVVVLESVDNLERMLKKMNKCALPRADTDIDMRRMEINEKTKQMEEETKRIEINEKTKQMEITAKTKQMEINPKTMLMQMLANKTITFEQYLQIKD